ncbi:transcription-repair coupling factor [Paracoccaceae bacterium GXU_MW_L88]
MVRTLVGGAPEGFDAKLIGDLVGDTKGPVLHIARDEARMAAVQASLRFFRPDLPVLRFPGWDCLPYDRVSPNASVSAARMAVLAQLAKGWDRPSVIIAPLRAAMQKLPSRQLVGGSSFTASVGNRIDEAALRAYLVRMGFNQVPTVMEPGDYAIRGGIIDIFPAGEKQPIRLDLFGDVLDAAKRFDPVTQRSGETVKQIALAPVSEVILEEETITRFRQNYRTAFGQVASDPLYEAVSAGRKHQGMEHWLGYFYEDLETLFTFLPGAPVTLDDQIPAMRAARSEEIATQYQTRLEAMEDKNRMGGTPYRPAPPETLYLDEAAWMTALEPRAVRQFSPNPTPSGPNVIDAGGRLGREFSAERKREEINLFSELAAHVKARLKEGPVVLASYSDGARDRMQSLLNDEGIASKTIARAGDVSEGVNLAVWALESGFTAPDLTVIAEQDILGDRLIRRAKKRRRAENFLKESSSLKQGDLVVHIQHGIGRYQGLETVDVTGAPHECLLLEYAGGDRLYLPAENIDLLSRYGHEQGLLDRLGGGAWQAKKEKLKERIKEMAEKLIRLAAERYLRNAPKFQPHHHLWEEFCARFPYQETEDQLTAIADVLSDFESGRPMDRLVCGDVGFGKTEVALRAAFIAAMEGHQVAVIAPTTLLARQHFQNFAERFRGFPLKVRQLSRFVSAKDAKATRDGLADGSVDIVIGAHALLAKSVRFKRLGLVIVDEEQHFGVAHKERLKALRSDVHVLTLTATPIPRTLQMALTGVRDLSIIGTPPVDRLAIRSYVSEFDPVTIREALLREHYRGGQSFIVVPRVSDIPEYEDMLKELVPEVKTVTAHGQLAAGDLDQRMNAFYDGQYDVLLATTIIESGLDIPRANTLIVLRADMFGLAQLYQIRGRVGRSKIRAYAYFMTEAGQRLTPAAQQRLKVLAALDGLGAGFALASQDLDIRGAGNILGEEQSGQVREVGYELYQDMLEEAIAKLKSGEMGDVDLSESWSPQINLGVPVLIPEDYVPDLDVRLGLYRRLSEMEKKVEMEGFAAELIDRFGPLPKEVDGLMNIMRIKAMCRRANVERLDGGPKGITLQFRDDKFPNPAGLVQFIQDQRGTAKVRDNKLVVKRDWDRDGQKVKGAFQIVRDLAALAKEISR